MHNPSFKKSRSPFRAFRKLEKKCDCPDVLLVDDNEFNIYTLQALMELCGYSAKMDVAHNGKQAVDKVLLKLQGKDC